MTKREAFLSATEEFLLTWLNCEDEVDLEEMADDLEKGSCPPEWIIGDVFWKDSHANDDHILNAFNKMWASAVDLCPWGKAE